MERALEFTRDCPALGKRAGDVVAEDGADRSLVASGLCRRVRAVVPRPRRVKKADKEPKQEESDE